MIQPLACLALLFALPMSALSAGIQHGEMAGYLLVPNAKVPERFNAGFSMYVAAWPLLKEYPGQQFQTGLFGTWMFAQHEGKGPTNAYSDIEGGLGWWRDTRFATETPKFIMGGVAPEFVEWANGPGAGKGRDWKKPAGKYGIAQLSPWVVWPPDGLNLKQGTSGDLFGYGYLPLPLAQAKSATAGTNVPTGDQCWTLFLNTRNFKGPVAFFTPYFWSRAAVDHPRLKGHLLDTRPSDPNRALQMETQYVPSVQATNATGTVYARIAPTSFPRVLNDDSILVHQVTSYARGALWDSVKSWFDGGDQATGRVDAGQAVLHEFPGNGGATWQIYLPTTPKAQKSAVDWKSFAKPTAIDAHTFGYRWNFEHVAKTETKDGLLSTLPEFFRLETRPGKKPEWVPIRVEDVPVETGLAAFRFDRPSEQSPEPYVTPDEPDSSWLKPGPVAGPFETRLGDGSVLTYSWYRFADQPALQHADLTAEEREQMQQRVEKLHRAWTKDREYLPPPGLGTLAAIDPALLLTPPPGLEVGYVPIATRQGLATPASEANASAPARETRSISGWQVHIQKKLLETEADAAEHALVLLKKMLDEIVRVVPEAAVVELQRVPLYFSPAYNSSRTGAEYHPDVGWLRANKRDPNMARAVEFSGVADFEKEMNRMPNFALHELAHAYHHRVLKEGFDNPTIKAQYERVKASGKYERVERWFGNGRPNTHERAYALTNPMEYFAEATEAFFVRNDFFPFTRDELKMYDPEVVGLLKQFWNKP